jgi:hypothetical protein
VAHFGAGLFGCEHPVDASADCVSLSLPGGDFALEFVCIIDSTVEALAAQHADLNFHHVQPAGVLGGVVELEAAQDASGFSRRESVIEGAAAWLDKLSCTTRIVSASG